MIKITCGESPSSISGKDTLHTVVEVVRSEIKPTREELDRAMNFFKELREVIESSLKLGHDFKVELEGSLAKGTCLRGEMDLDVFILIKNDMISSEWIKSKVIDPLTTVLSRHYRVRLRYAAHPYIHVVHEEGIEADIVPAYWAGDIKEIKTSVDRTPFHTRFIINTLTEEQKDEVRLLKKFFKGIGVYGAEIKVEGFSGYLCELLIIKYGSFINTLKFMSKWRAPQVITLGNVSKYELNTLFKLFGENPLIFPDPVDPRRNAAASVSKRSMGLAVVASNCFLENPDSKFFYPSKRALSIEELSKYVDETKRCVSYIVLKIDSELSPDVLWGVLKKFLRKGENIISQFSFRVIDSRVWCDEVKYAVIFYETELCGLSRYRLHEGPPPYVKIDLRKFISKYLNSASFGPWVGNDGRLYVLRKRRYIGITDVLLNEVLSKLPKNFSVIDVLVNTLSRFPRDLLRNEEFTYWLTETILKVPPWMSLGCKSGSLASALR